MTTTTFYLSPNSTNTSFFVQPDLPDFNMKLSANHNQRAPLNCRRNHHFCPLLKPWNVKAGAPIARIEPLITTFDCANDSGIYLPRHTHSISENSCQTPLWNHLIAQAESHLASLSCNAYQVWLPWCYQVWSDLWTDARKR
jgi:hypothetical protein